jgi:glutaredoxin
MPQARPIEVVLYTRRGCHLCDEAKLAMAPLVEEFGAALREVDVDSDPALAAQHGLDVPVILLDGRKAAKHRVDARKLRRQLEEARRKRL